MADAVSPAAFNQLMTPHPPTGMPAPCAGGHSPDNFIVG
jgi:hypothetical protein